MFVPTNRRVSYITSAHPQLKDYKHSTVQVSSNLLVPSTSRFDETNNKKETNFFDVGRGIFLLKMPFCPRQTTGLNKRTNKTILLPILLGTTFAVCDKLYRQYDCPANRTGAIHNIFIYGLIIPELANDQSINRLHWCCRTDFVHLSVLSAKPCIHTYIHMYLRNEETRSIK